MPRFTPEERDDRRRVRSDLWKEGMRLVNLPPIRNFVLENCVRRGGTETVNIGGTDVVVSSQSLRYEYKNRNKNKPKVALKEIIRDNIRPSLVNDKVPHAWGDVEEKIEALEFIVRVVMVPRGEKPWLPEPEQGGQGRGRGGKPNN